MPRSLDQILQSLPPARRRAIQALALARSKIAAPPPPPPGASPERARPKLK